MKTRPARRFGILVLALALVPGQFSTADAGVIPWLYDAVFGPVGHYGYGGGYGYGAPSTYSNYGGPRISYAVPSNSYRSSNCGPAECGPAGCATAPYRVSYSPFFGIPRLCPTGGCSPAFAGYRNSSGNCGACAKVACATSTCDAKTDWKAKEAKTEWSAEVVGGEAAVPTPAIEDEAPRPKTFKDEPADPSQAQPTAVGKVVTGESAGVASGAKPGDPNWQKTGKPAAEVTTGAAAEKVAPGSVGTSNEVKAGAQPAAGDAQSEKAGGEASAGFGKTQREGEAAAGENFKTPIPGAVPKDNGDAAPTKTQKLPDDAEGSPAAESDPGLNINLPLKLENQSSWKFEVPVRRIAFRAGFSRAKIARTAVSVNVDYVVPSTVALRLVSR